MATYYYDLSLGSNGTGTTASPYNVWPGTAVSAGDSHLFKRGTTGLVNFAISSGANGAITRYGAWFNADGSDDSAQARPIISTTGALSTFGTKKGHLRIENLDIRASTLTTASDASLVFLSNSATIVNCNLSCNNGGIGIWGASNVTIQSCTAQAVSHSNSFNNQVLIVSGTVDQSSIAITSNTFLHWGGGGASSHTINLECTDSTKAVSKPVITGNYISTVASASCSNTYAMGIRMVRAGSASIADNTVKYHNVGLFSVGGGTATTAMVSSNTFVNNYHFGIQFTTDMVGCTIQYNTCSSNGTPTHDGLGLYAYGRGIELSSAAGQSRCASHTIRFNTCNSNLNYGGPADNGSEGVGIGLDDGVVNCIVYGNTCKNNEGNGIQLYGGGNSATWTDTHNTIFANLLGTNCTASIKNRRTGGTFRTLFCADINLAYTYGGPTIIANNLHIGGTSCGVAMGNSNGGSITMANNVMLGMPNCFMDGRSVRAGTDYKKNWLYGTTNFNFVLDTTDANGAPTYPIIPSFQATTDSYFTNPQMSSGSSPAWMPAFGSPCIGVAYSLSAVSADFQGNNFKSPATVGMFEYVGNYAVPGGVIRRGSLGRR